MTKRKWPKEVAKLTEHQKWVKSDFMYAWHAEGIVKYSMIEDFNHRGAIKKEALPPHCRTLEVGAGLGAHLAYEDLSAQEYHVMEVLPSMLEELKKRYPQVLAHLGDIQERQDLPDNSFDRIVVVHVLEHLPNLPAALAEIRRLVKPDGICDFVIPCEGSFAYQIARNISARRMFEKRYKMSYDWCYKSEHINTCEETLCEIAEAGFEITWQRYFPFPVPMVWPNLAIGMRCHPRK